MRMNKKDKVALVPKLRFPEFKSAKEWVQKPLGDVTYKVSQKNAEGKKYPIYSINNKEGFLPQSDQFEGMDSNSRGYDIRLYKVVDKNTFAYNPARINVGSIGYSGELFDIIISSLYVCFKTDEEIEDNFLQCFLATSIFNRQVEKNTEGGIRSYLFYENFSKILFQFPQKAEQQKIADCLSSLDDLITAEDKKLEALKAHKKGLMQKLFPAEGKTVPEWRFPEFKDSGEWEISTLDVLAVKIIEKNNDKSLDRVLTNSAVNGVVDQQCFFDKDIANRSNLANYYVLDKGDYVYNPRISVTAPVGPISRNNVGKGVISPLYTVFRFRNKRNDYFEHFFKTTCWHKYLKNISNTGARHDRISVSSDAFMNMPLIYPASKKEQQKIAECLYNLDYIITVQSERIKALQTHKIGLMQGLFPSVEVVGE